MSLTTLHITRHVEKPENFNGQEPYIHYVVEGGPGQDDLSWQETDGPLF